MTRVFRAIDAPSDRVNRINRSTSSCIAQTNIITIISFETMYLAREIDIHVLAPIKYILVSSVVAHTADHRFDERCAEF